MAWIRLEKRYPNPLLPHSDCLFLFLCVLYCRWRINTSNPCVWIQWISAAGYEELSFSNNKETNSILCWGYICQTLPTYLKVNLTKTNKCLRCKVGTFNVHSNLGNHQAELVSYLNPVTRRNVAIIECFFWFQFPMLRVLKGAICENWPPVEHNTNRGQQHITRVTLTAANFSSVSHAASIPTWRSGELQGVYMTSTRALDWDKSRLAGWCANFSIHFC